MLSNKRKLRTYTRASFQELQRDPRKRKVISSEAIAPGTTRTTKAVLKVQKSELKCTFCNSKGALKMSETLDVLRRYYRVQGTLNK